MFRVLIVDDEPVAVDYISTIIKNKCSQFCVVATAENAKEGIKKANKYKPDLIITDIKMPFMNGIEMVIKIKQDLPYIHSIIVSGYQDFEYTKGAIKSQTLDYILKPINPTILKNTLDNIIGKLRITRSKERNNLVQSMSRGIIPNKEDLERCFSSEQYYAALVRKNGLPRRFSKKFEVEIFSGQDEMIYLYGRDEMEALYIFPKELIYPDKVTDLVSRIVEKEMNASGYITSVIKTNSFPAEKLFEVINSLYKKLDSNIIIGCNQNILLDNHVDEQKNIITNDIIFKEIDYIIKEQKWDMLNRELIKLINKWKEERRPQLWIERFIRRILYSMQIKYSINFSGDYEFMLEDAFFYATSMEELGESLLDVFCDFIADDQNCCKKLDSETDTIELIENIKKYLNRNLSTPITIQKVCKEFGVSQTYLSKLFRKYEDQTFNNYVTYIRIKYAKRLIEANKDFLVKDVAAMVGYNDQFYFSRVFSSIVGVPPSVYAENITR